MFKKGNFTFILGPCLVEDHAHAVRHATYLRKLSDELHVPVVYKSSWLKDNRTSKDSPRGHIDNLAILKDLRGILPVITDIHEPAHAEFVSECVDAIQIPAMLSRQTNLLEAAGEVGLPVLIKKGQGMDWSQAYDAAEKVGIDNVALCERGTFFGYGKLVVDFEQLADVVGDWVFPIYFDATHSANDGPRGAHYLARAAAALKVDGIFAEVHSDPKRAPSDGARMIQLDDIERFMEMCLRLRYA